MAVIHAVPGLTVNVKVLGRVATEYEAPEEEASGDQAGAAEIPRSTCYIESTSGLTFSVHATVAPGFDHSAPYDALLLRVFIDGRYVAGSVQYKGTVNLTQPIVSEISYATTSSDRHGFVNSHSFTFAPVSSVEDVAGARIARDIKTAGSLGVIRLRATLGYGGTIQQYISAPLRDSGQLELAEKAMKGKELSHATSFPTGAVIAQPQVTTFRRESNLGDFFFKYRSRDALVKEFIIPPSASSTPVPDDIDNLSELEIRRLAREMLHVKQQNRRSESKSVKQESNDVDATGSLRVYKTVRLEDGKEAVDLTDD